MGEAHPGRWIWNADEDVTGRALDLPPPELGFAFERLIAM